MADGNYKGANDPDLLKLAKILVLKPNKLWQSTLTEALGDVSAQLDPCFGALGETDLGVSLVGS